MLTCETPLLKKAHSLTGTGFLVVGVRGFEPPTSSSRTTRANRTAPHPEFEERLCLFSFSLKKRFNQARLYPKMRVQN